MNESRYLITADTGNTQPVPFKKKKKEKRNKEKNQTV
jgi:hypothetical protein